MNPIKLIILWLGASVCWAEIIRMRASESDNLATLANFTVEILSSCYENKAETVGLAGTLDDALFETLCSKQSLPIALIGNDNPNELVDQKSRHKLQLFVVSASSSEQLERILRQIKNSHWWNHMATYFILFWDHASLKHGCSNAFPFLWKAWQMNLLKAFYACLHSTRGRRIYSFNPYTNKAPKPWQLEKMYEGQNNHPWFMFQIECYIDEEICKNLEFDKTNDLGGYKINSTVKNYPSSFLVNISETGGISFSGREGNFITAVLNALKINVRYIVHDKKIPALYDKMGRDIAMDTVDGVSDVLLIPRLHSVVQNYTLSYPFHETGFSIMTQLSGDMSQLEKLLTVLDKSSRFAICLIFFTTVIFFKIFLRQPLGTAILNVLRIVTNSSLTKKPKNQGPRIYLAAIFFAVVTIIGIYQGMLASLLTKSKPLRNVDTLQDLVQREYTIHSHELYAYLFNDPVFKGRYFKHPEYNCTEYVLRDSTAACVAQQTRLIHELATFNQLHLSSENIIKTSFVFVIREDWPLEERFNIVLAALVEADINHYLMERDADEILNIAKFNKQFKQNQKYQVMTLSELTFAFVFLAVGLACATVCMIIEVAISLLLLRLK